MRKPTITIIYLMVMMVIIGCGKEPKNSEILQTEATNPLLATETLERFHKAIDENDYNTFIQLINNVDLHHQHRGLSPILRAITAEHSDENNKEIILTLLEKGISVNTQDARGSSLLMLSIEHQKFELADYLLHKFAQEISSGESIDVSVQNILGQTALFLAIENRQEDLAISIIDKGAALDLINRNGKSLYQLSLDYRLRNVSNKITTELAIQGTTPNTHALFAAIELSDLQAVENLLGQFPLESYNGTQDILGFLAITPNQHQARSIARLLLASGANPVGYHPFAPTPLMKTAMLNNEVVASVLISEAPHTINLSDTHGSTALVLAIRHASDRVARMIINSGDANINRRDASGKTPLLWAVLENNDLIVKLLVDSGADKNKRDASNRSPCWHSSKVRDRLADRQSSQTEMDRIENIRSILGCWFFNS